MPLLSPSQETQLAAEPAGEFAANVDLWGFALAGEADSDAAQGGWLSRFCRDRVLQLLSRIQSGSLQLIDGDDVHRFGDQQGLAAAVYVRDPKFYRRLVFDGQLGGAEGYIHGEWATDNLVNLIRLLVQNADVLDGMEQGFAAILSPVRNLYHRLRPNSPQGSRRNIAAHYDLGNDFFAEFLDTTLTYSCGLFDQPTTTLEQAATAKYDYVCRSLDLSATDHVLEIGTGWGGFSLHAAMQFGCRVTTTTISREQYHYARAAVKAAGLEDRVEILLSDYRDLTGKFDKLVSIEMIEAVGHRYLPTFFGKCSDLLREDGAMLLHAITLPDPLYDNYRRSMDFIQKYIFPGGCLLSVAAMTTANAASANLRLLHQEDFSYDYAQTLAIWRQRFHRNLANISAIRNDDRFLRAWDYYFAYCESAFLERRIGLSHMLWTKPQSRLVMPRVNR